MSRVRLVLLFGAVQSTWAIKTGLSVKKKKGFDASKVECDPDYDCLTNKVFCNAGPPFEEVVRQCCPAETCLNVQSPQSIEVSHLDLASSDRAAPVTIAAATSATPGTPVPAVGAPVTAVGATTTVTKPWSKCSSEVSKQKEARKQGREKYRKDRSSELEKKRQTREDARKLRSGKRESLRNVAEKEVKKTRTKCTEFEVKKQAIVQHKREERCRRRRSDVRNRRRRSSQWMNAIKEQLKYERHRQKVKEYADQRFSALQPPQANQSLADGQGGDKEIVELQKELQGAVAQEYIENERS